MAGLARLAQLAVDGLHGGQGVWMLSPSPDGEHLFSAAYGQDPPVVLKWRVATGERAR